MAYSTNPNLPKARGNSVALVIRDGLTQSSAARKSGVHRVTIWRWVKKWRELHPGIQLANPNRPNRPIGRYRLVGIRWDVPTTKSTPKTFPSALADWIVARILAVRAKLKRCAEVCFAHLRKEGVPASLSSVKRTFKRNHIYDRKKWGRRPYARNPHRPLPTAPGELVQIDTVHLMNPIAGTRLYVFTIIDLYTRMAYAQVSERILQSSALSAILEAERAFGFSFKMVQCDNGFEFGGDFKSGVEKTGAILRHSRPSRPNDNAHIERFNRTLREECIGQYSAKSPEAIRRSIDKFLRYYNHDRIHLGLQMRTPFEMLQR